MLKNVIRTVALAAGLSAFLITAAEGQTMNHKLSEPAAVPLDFLDWMRTGCAKAWQGRA